MYVCVYAPECKAAIFLYVIRIKEKDVGSFSSVSDSYTKGRFSEICEGSQVKKG